jgi:hypothetical protein
MDGLVVTLYQCYTAWPFHLTPIPWTSPGATRIQLRYTFVALTFVEENCTIAKSPKVSRCCYHAYNCITAHQQLCNHLIRV